MDYMRHPILLSLYKIELHLNCLLRIRLPVTHQLFVFQHFLPVLVGSLIHLLIATFYSVHCLLFSQLKFLDLL
jgi:hypothetical protein